MVFVWSNLTDGDPHFTLTQVALNDTIMVVRLRADRRRCCSACPSITVPWDTLFLSVVLYIVVPVIVAQLWRRALLRARRRGGARRLRCARCSRCRSRRCWRRWCCCSASRASRSCAQPLVIALLAVPILIQVYFNAGARLLAQPRARRAHMRRRPVGADRRLATSSSWRWRRDRLFGFQSGAALATVVGVLVEVPVMLSVVRIVLKSRRWYERPCRLSGAARP